MEAAEWKQAWGLDRLIFARKHDRQLPNIARSFLNSHGLPRIMIFEGENPFEISFACISQELVAYNQTITWGDFYDEKRDKAWSQQLVLADEEFRNGHASYCVYRTDETVTRIDVEIPKPEMFVNSGVPQFGESLLLAMQWSAAHRWSNAAEWETSLSELKRDLKAIDPQALTRHESFWRWLIEYIQEHEPGSFEISSDPARSKPRF